MIIDRYDNTINNVHIGTPAQEYTLDIANESLNYDMNWLIDCITKMLGW